MKNYRLSLIFVFIILLSSNLMSAEKGRIVIQAGVMRNDRGVLKAALYNSAKYFPSRSENAVKKGTSKIENGSSAVIFESVEYGEYAVSVYHDENNNGKLDTKFFGKPKEGVGYSNNAKGKFGPPSYNEAKFQIDSATVTVKINIYQ